MASIIKFLLKLAIGIGFAAFVCVMLYNGLRPVEPISNDMSDIIRVYNINATEIPDGEVTQCPICRQNFTKMGGFNFCSAMHEREYIELLNAYHDMPNGQYVFDYYGKNPQ